jgi:hypothetical protein
MDIKQALEANKIDIDTLKEGDKVFAILLSAYGHVIKKNKVSFVIRLADGRERKTTPRACGWRDTREIHAEIYPPR